jgi:NAD(P)-dependent dehydrogenase (short-subunit alcohol dehydrogenase family)
MLSTAGLAAAYGPRGVRVNAVNPGPTLTERLHAGLLAEARMNGGTPEEALAKASSELPLGRIATPEEIADVVVFLCSARAGYVSGAILAMDGASTPMVV